MDPCAELAAAFGESAMGAFVLAGSDAGTVKVSIDGARPLKVDLFQSRSKGLHYRRPVLFADGLSAGSHTLRPTVSSEKDTASAAMRFAPFTLS